jgi:exonuclease VII small subunit
MADFAQFFGQEIQQRKSKIFKTKDRLEKLISDEIQDAEEEIDGTAIQNSNDNVEDIVKRNIIESQDIPLEKVILNYFLNFRIINSFHPDPILF